MNENVKNNQISDEQLECVGGGNGTDDESLQDMIMTIEQSGKQADNLSANVTMVTLLGSGTKKEPKEDIKKTMEKMAISQNKTIPKRIF